MSAGGVCPPEALRRVSLCQKIVRSYLSPNPNANKPQIVPHASSFSGSVICKTLAAHYPATVNAADCQRVAAHLIGASNGAAGLQTLNRRKDIHDVCVDLLTASFPKASNQRLMATGDAAKCSLAATGGVTGVRCLLLHGMGITRLKYKGDSTGSIVKPYTANSFDGWLSMFPKYWSAERALDGICDVRYYVTDTEQRGWTDSGLQAEYCAAIETFDPHVVATHSMGNLIIAAGVRNNVGACKRIGTGEGQIRWLSSQAPWLGSPMVTSTKAACAPTPAKKGVLGKIAAAAQKAFDVARTIIRSVHPCGKEKASLSLDPALKPAAGTPTFKQLRDTAAAKLSGSICGLDADPLTPKQLLSLNGAGLWALQALGTQLGIVDWGKDTKSALPPSTTLSGNDGLVPWSSCNIPGKAWTASPGSAFYTAAVSHQDGTCFTPDQGAKGAAKQPCNWYQRQVGRVRTAKGFALKSPNIEAVARLASYQPFGRFAYPKSFLQLQAQTDAAAEVEAAAEAEGEMHSHLEAAAEAAADAQMEAEASAEMHSHAALMAEVHLQELQSMRAQTEADDALEALNAQLAELE